MGYGRVRSALRLLAPRIAPGKRPGGEIAVFELEGDCETVSTPVLRHHTTPLGGGIWLVIAVSENWSRSPVRVPVSDMVANEEPLTMWLLPVTAVPLTWNAVVNWKRSVIGPFGCVNEPDQFPAMASPLEQAEPVFTLNGCQPRSHLAYLPP
jgi:hypothetical protein